MKKIMGKTIAVGLVVIVAFTMNLSTIFAANQVKALNIPDENFRKEIVESQGILNNRAEPVQAGEKLYARYNIYTSDIEKLEEVTVLNVNNKVIENLQGIEYFTKLETLYCANNYLEKLDLTKNPNLKNLYCHMNKLTDLNLSKNKNLEKLYCYGNEISKIKLKGNTKTVELWASGNSPIQYDPATEPDDIIIAAPGIVVPAKPETPKPENPKPENPKPEILKPSKPFAPVFVGVQRTKNNVNITIKKAPDADGIIMYKKIGKKGKYKKAAALENKSKQTINIKKLKKNSRIEIKFRSYKIVDGKYIYGKYTKTIIIQPGL